MIIYDDERRKKENAGMGKAWYSDTGRHELRLKMGVGIVTVTSEGRQKLGVG